MIKKRENESYELHDLKQIHPHVEEGGMGQLVFSLF